MKNTYFFTIAWLILIGCSPIKQHQRLVRKHPEVLNLISTPKHDTVRIENTKYIECPDGTVITVNCDTLVVYETNTITLPPTNAQIRQQERTKRNYDDNVRKMYKDSLEHVKQMYQDSLEHVRQIYKLENKRLKDEIKKLLELSEDSVKIAKSEAKAKNKPRFNVFEKIIMVIGSLALVCLVVFAYWVHRKF